MPTRNGSSSSQSLGSDLSEKKTIRKYKPSNFDEVYQLSKSDTVKYWVGLMNDDGTESESSKSLKKTYDDFVSNLSNYQQDNTSAEQREKWKENLISNFLKLPEKIRNEILIPNENIKGLYRGAWVETTPTKLAGGGNTMAASFTSLKYRAQAFAKGEGIEKDDMKGKVYTAKDIKSLDGIIDVNKAYRLAQAYNNKIESGQWVPSKDAESGLKMKKYASSAKLKADLKYVEEYIPEQEYVVYGIKWKGGVA